MDKLFTPENMLMCLWILAIIIYITEKDAKEKEKNENVGGCYDSVNPLDHEINPNDEK